MSRLFNTLIYFNLNLRGFCIVLEHVSCWTRNVWIVNEWQFKYFIKNNFIDISTFSHTLSCTQHCSFDLLSCFMARLDMSHLPRLHCSKLPCLSMTSCLLHYYNERCSIEIDLTITDSSLSRISHLDTHVCLQ